MKQEIKPTYVTFEQAKLLKEKWFNELCLTCYKFDCTEKEYNLIQENSITYFNNRQQEEGYVPEIAAPEQWQVVEWLRVEHGIWISVSITIEGKWYFELFNLKEKRNSEIFIKDESIKRINIKTKLYYVYIQKVKSYYVTNRKSKSNNKVQR
jgi:hypothetical protein